MGLSLADTSGDCRFFCERGESHSVYREHWNTRSQSEGRWTSRAASEALGDVAVLSWSPRSLAEHFRSLADRDAAFWIVRLAIH